MIQNNKNVVIVTPAREFSPCYVRSFFNTVKYCSQNNIELSFLHESGAHVGQLRDKLAFRVLTEHSEYTHMFWIDSDIEWSVSDFCSLLESPHMITSGIYVIRGDGSLSVVVKKSPQQILEETANNLEASIFDYKFAKMEDLNTNVKYINIDAAGFGFVCFKQGVFENIHNPYFADVEEEAVTSDGRVIKRIVTSEDTAMFKRAKDAGFDAVVDTDVKVGHFKSSVLVP